MVVVTAVAMAVSSTICGALLVEAGQRHDRSAAFVNQQWLWFNVALMGASALGGWLTDVLTPVGALHAACWIAAVAPLTVLGSLALVEEAPARLRLAALRQRLGGLLHALRLRPLWFVALFLFGYYFSPGLGTPLYYHMTDRLGFSQAFIGLLATVNAAGWILGGLLYRWVLSRLGTGVLLPLSILCGTASTLAYLALVDAPTAIAIYLLAGIAGMIANIATLSLAAERCPAGAEGFVFAALMSVINLATPVSDALGSVLYEYVFARRLAPLIVVSAALTAAVFLLLPLARVRAPAPPLSAVGAAGPPPRDP
jgi:MFS family permease